ncbi:hypothetical protein QQF64_001321 [Cirrhinus molitorella]|uniref:Uncharacterized protein n=1 Tax=Cirrhinus molitorella TaxID=172907 RepID=A0ABR3P0M9_9TELE
MTAKNHRIVFNRLIDKTNCSKEPTRRSESDFPSLLSSLPDVERSLPIRVSPEGSEPISQRTTGNTFPERRESVTESFERENLIQFKGGIN